MQSIQINLPADRVLALTKQIMADIYQDQVKITDEPLAMKAIQNTIEKKILAQFNPIIGSAIILAIDAEQEGFVDLAK